MPATTFYPSLSTLIRVDDLPSELGVVKEGLSDFFDHFFYRDLQIQKSVDGDAAFYSLKLLTYKRLALEVPGTGGLALILNPSLAAGVQGASSEFPISVRYKWPILKYVRAFNLQSFDFSGAGFYDIILNLTGITKDELLAEALTVLTNDPAPVQQFVSLFNSDPRYNPATPLVMPATADLPAAVADLLTQLTDNGNDFDAYLVILEQYVANAGSPSDILARVERLFKRWLGGFTIEHVKKLLTPEVSASIDELSVGIQFPSAVLREVDANGDPLADPDNPSEDKPAVLKFDIASLQYSTGKGLEFELAQNLNVSFPRSELLRTGFILDIHDLKLDLSRKTNIPEAVADGRPDDFVGVYVKDGTISFPAFWNHNSNSTGVIKARNLLVGTGGISGTLSLEAIAAGVSSPPSAPVVELKFGKDFAVSLKKFSLTFKQNAITDSNIEGTLVIPGLKDATGQTAQIRIKVAIRQDGDFDVTAHEDDGFKEFECGGVFNLRLKSVYFGRKDDDFYLGVAGGIKFTHPMLSQIAKDEIEVEKLIIWSDGRFEIEGGTIPLPQNLRFPIGPAEISITAIHLGSHQRIDDDGSTTDFRYFGFDGGVDINPGGVDVRGRGIKFYFPVNGPLSLCYLEIKSLAIDLVIPGSASKDTATLLIAGYLSVGGTASDPEYEGGITFALPKAQIAGGAAMKYRPRKPAFVVDAFVEISTPILLGSTGLGIYGFRGLFGLRYLATKHAAGLTDDAAWFDYYKVKAGNPPLEGVSVAKLETPDDMPDNTGKYDNAFSIGAGVSLATAQDSGKTFSLKLFLLLSLPDLIYLEGKANILGDRVGLTGEDPPFSAMLAISRHSVETGVGVNYKLPREGSNQGRILDLNAEMRAAFFFQNSSAWYINFGTVEKPTTARVLSLFDATSYLMISASGIRAGAGVTFEFNKSYAGGAVRASVGVYIKVGGFISFERPQIGGFAMLAGHVDVSLMWFSFYLSIDTSLSVEVPKPFYVQGEVHLCVGVTIGFWKFKKQIEKCFDVEFRWEKDTTVDTTPVLPFKDPTSDPTARPPLGATNMLSGETFPVLFFGTSLPSGLSSAFDSAVLPLDTWIDMEFLKGLRPGPDVDARIGRLSGQAPANSVEYIPPAEVAHKVKHEYSITKVDVLAWDGSAWVEYRPFQAMGQPAALAALAANPSGYKDGYWQNSGTGFNKLRLLAETSFSYMQQGQPGWYVPERFGITSATLFCRTKLREKFCVRWEDVDAGTVYNDGAWRQADKLLCRVSGGPGTVVAFNSHFGVTRSLAFSNNATAEVVFDKPCVEVSLKLTTFSEGAVIRFYKRETAGTGVAYTVIETRPLTQQQLLAPVHYNDPARTVSKVVIEPVNTDPDALHSLRVRIDALYRQLYEDNPEGRLTDILLAQIRTLEEELTHAEGRACTPEGIAADVSAQQIPALQQQLEECRRQLAALLAEQQKACVLADELRSHFEHCFTRAPLLLSYEIVEGRGALGRPRFWFRVHDDLAGAVLFNGIKRFPTPAEAEAAMTEMLELALRPGSYAYMFYRPSRYFIRIVGLARSFIAVNPVNFKTAGEVFEAGQRIRDTLRKSYSGGKFQLVRRIAGRLLHDECLSQLDCWGELPPAAPGTPPDAETAAIIALRDKFCEQHTTLYRELYEYNLQQRDKATHRCEELTRALETKTTECRAIGEQLEAVRRLVEQVGDSGALLPPEGLPCSTLLHEVCCLSLEDHEFNLSIPTQEAVEEDYQNAAGAIEKMLTPVWRPGTKYCIHLRVSDTVNDGASQDSDFYFGFRTAGPLGHFHNDPSANYVAQGKTADQYMLTGLKGYLDYRRCYPNADGQLVGAKPLFYEDARILLFFTKRYVYHLFGDWPAYNGLPALAGNSMQVVVKDPSEDISIPNPPPLNVVTTAIPRAVTAWESDDDPRIPEDVRALLSLRNPELLNPDFEGGDCWSSGGEMIKPASLYTTVTPQYLKPLKLYTAIVNNIYLSRVQEVHRFVFQTSRYPDFEAQVNSYRLDDGHGNTRDAVFRVGAELMTADINLMYDIVAGGASSVNAALASTWADPFDRLVEGVLKLAPLDAAVSTEFNVVRDVATERVVAVWVRSPEPFNDTKLPDDVLPRTLRVMRGTTPDPRYKVLFSKDRAQAVVMNSHRLMPATLRFRFAYVEWDGSNYVDRSVVVTDPIHTNV